MIVIDQIYVYILKKAPDSEGLNVKIEPISLKIWFTDNESNHQVGLKSEKVGYSVFRVHPSFLGLPISISIYGMKSTKSQQQ